MSRRTVVNISHNICYTFEWVINVAYSIFYSRTQLLCFVWGDISKMDPILMHQIDRQRIWFVQCQNKINQCKMLTCIFAVDRNRVLIDCQSAPNAIRWICNAIILQYHLCHVCICIFGHQITKRWIHLFFRQINISSITI